VSRGNTGLECRLEGKKPMAVGSSAICDKDNVPVSMVFHFRDLSRIQSLNLLFSRTDQLAALGTFTMGLSHELRNPLGAIKGTAQLLKDKIPDRSDCVSYLQHIVREVDRLDKLVRELYDFSRFPGGAKTICDLNQLTRETLDQVLRGSPPTLKSGKTLREEYTENLPRVLVQRDRMMRAIGNVLLNALENMPQGATLVLRTGIIDEAPQTRIMLEVANTGSAIPKEDLDKIFEPFFSTKPSGMGLGLAISYQIAVQNRCLLRASSDGDSVCFRFAFRTVEAASKPESAQSKEIPGAKPASGE
jgi:two-component system sensor histidine kinase HydH